MRDLLSFPDFLFYYTGMTIWIVIGLLLGFTILYILYLELGILSSSYLPKLKAIYTVLKWRINSIEFFLDPLLDPPLIQRHKYIFVNGNRIYLETIIGNRRRHNFTKYVRMTIAWKIKRWRKKQLNFL